MSLKRWAARRDESEAAIVDALEQVGAKIMKLDKFDLLVHYKGTLVMLDAKCHRGRATMAQDALIRDGWPLRLVETPIDALKAVGAVR